MSESDFPEVPETADEMLVRWANRDAEYAKQRKPLDIDTIRAVREGRMREASYLPVADRANMWMRANTWTPPVHGEFGSIKDWLS